MKAQVVKKNTVKEQINNVAPEQRFPEFYSLLSELL